MGFGPEEVSESEVLSWSSRIAVQTVLDIFRIAEVNIEASANRLWDQRLDGALSYDRY